MSQALKTINPIQAVTGRKKADTLMKPNLVKVMIEMRLLMALMCGWFCISHNAYALEQIIHKAVPDRIITSGKLLITTEDLNSEEFVVTLDYEVKARVFFFSKTIKGRSVEVLPMKFRFSYGYEELEETGSMIYKKIQLTHVKRFMQERFGQCHMVHLKPLSHDKWEGNLAFCAEVPGAGFATTELTYKKVPILGRHTMHTVLARQ